MRELKFRAWNQDYKWMDYDFYISSRGVFFGEPSRFFDTPNTEIEESPNLIVMQFTGLKDRNGADIYEGDIVSDHIGVGVVKYSDKNGAFRVSYGDGIAKWFYDYILNGERESIEVIGNIHENPELMEPTEC